MPQSYRGYTLTKLGEKHWLQQTRSQNTTGKNGLILRYFFRFPLQGMHGICCHVSVFLIKPTPTLNNTLQFILKISIFQFADPTYSYPINLGVPWILLILACSLNDIAALCQIVHSKIEGYGADSEK